MKSALEVFTKRKNDILEKIIDAIEKHGSFYDKDVSSFLRDDKIIDSNNRSEMYKKNDSFNFQITKTRVKEYKENDEFNSLYIKDDLGVIESLKDLGYSVSIKQEKLEQEIVSVYSVHSILYKRLFGDYHVDQKPVEVNVEVKKYRIQNILTVSLPVSILKKHKSL